MTKAMRDKDSAVLQKQLTKLLSIQDELILKVQTKKKFNSGADCAPIDFKQSSKIEYSDGVFITDLTTDEQVRLGINIFKVIIEKTTAGPLHTHTGQTQVLHVIAGSIFDEVAKVSFDAGSSFFMAKNTSHKVKYMEGTELIAVYIPSLHIMSDSE